MRCVELALGNPPSAGDRVGYLQPDDRNSTAFATSPNLWRGFAGARVAYIPNPRKEAAENDLVVDNRKFLALGLDPTTLAEGLLGEVVDIARKFAHRIDRSRVPAVSAWTRDLASKIDHDPERRRLKSAS